jgi:hypothetical protein
MSVNISSTSLIQTTSDNSLTYTKYLMALTYTKYLMAYSLQGLPLYMKQEVINESASTATGLLEILSEWPEIATLAMKFIYNLSLTGTDEQNLKELASATGWNTEDIKNELVKLTIDPSKRAEEYKDLLEKYYKEALELFNSGDTRQAGEKIWASVLALMKLYASLKRIFIEHWSRGKIDNFIASNVEPKHRKLFRELIDRAQILHEHFYEGHLNKELFKERWNEVIELFKKAKEIVYEEFQL